MASINRAVLSGRLTRDPDLRHTPGGTPVCKLRIAVNTRQKSPTGEWSDKPNYFDVAVWGNRGESCAEHLAKGRQVLIDGRLDWREWDAQDGTKRQAVEIIADRVEFIGGRSDSDQQQRSSGDFAAPADSGDHVASGSSDYAAGAADPDSDIPF